MALNWDRARKQALEIDKKYNTARSITPGASSGTAYVPGTSKYTAAANITPKRTVTALPNAGTPTADRARNNLVTGNRLLPHVTEYQGIPVSGKKNGYWQADTSDLEQQRLAAGLKSVPSMAFHYHYDAEAENKRMEESRAEAGRLTAEIAARKNNLYQLQRDEKRSALETGAPSSPAMLPALKGGTDRASQAAAFLLEHQNSTGKDSLRMAREMATVAFGFGTPDKEPADLPAVEEMTEAERKTLLSYVAAGDLERANEYLDLLERDLNARRQGEASERNRAGTEENPALGVLGNIGASFGSPLAYGANAAQFIKNAVTGEYVPTDYNSDWFSMAHAVEDTQQVLHDKAVEAGGEAGGFLADTGLSIGQFASKIPLGPFALPVMALGAGGQETLSTLERGGTTGQAFAMGTASAAAEALTEKLPLDNLFRLAKAGGGGLRQTLTAILKQAGIEAAEESVSELANNLADASIMGAESAYNRAVQARMAQGESRAEAERNAALQFYGKNVALAALGGALSGGAMGTGAAALGSANARAQTRAESRAIDNAYNSMLENGMFSPQAQQASQNANRIIGLPTYRQNPVITLPNPSASQAQALQSENAAPWAAVEATGQNNTASSGEAESTAVDTNPARHTAAEQAVIDAYQAAVDDNLANFVETALENKGSNRGKYTLKPVSARATADIKALTGIDTSGFKTVLEQRIAEHIVERHGANGAADTSMQDINDIARMQYVLDNYDSMEPAGYTRAYTTNKPNGRPGQAKTVKYIKAVNGTYYIIEAVPDTKAKTTFIVSAYMSNKKAGESQTTDANAPAWTAKPENATTPALISIISENPAGGNARSARNRAG